MKQSYNIVLSGEIVDVSRLGLEARMYALVVKRPIPPHHHPHPKLQITNQVADLAAKKRPPRN